MKYNDFFQIDEASLSKSELEIHNFMKNNTKAILNMNIVDVEKQTFLSRATIERYLKKVGTKGFKTYKIKLNEFLNFNNEPVTYDEITKLILSYQDKTIGITAQGTSFLAAQYLNRRLKFLKFNSQAESLLELNGVKPNFDLLIVISIRGLNYMGLDTILEHYNIPIIAITKPNSYLDDQATLTIDNLTQDHMNSLDIDDMSSTINIIETLIRDIAKKSD
ncbi:hypothetical protein RZE82_05365 [Mollicutes bacterium LVI A0039]|nr:hypothetical protein RZE82_05365 [Mollicutes bacterium LVI A0039]